MELAKFSHIFVEREALRFPFAQQFLERFPKAHVTLIDSYKSVFQRPHQSWKAQKRTLKPILAVKRDQFLYQGSTVAPDYGHANFYYNALVMNCLYDCHYCYLQGMFRSGYSVFFVNIEDFLNHTRNTLKEKGSSYLALSYDTDLLAYEDLLPYVQTWLQEASSWDDLLMEVRTKSAHKKLFSLVQPPSNTIFAWTLSPKLIASQYETNTASLGGRLAALQHALQNGFRVRICIDPILRVENWREQYQSLVEQLAALPNIDAIEDISVGAFRTNKQYFKAINKIRAGSPLLRSLEEDTDGLMRYGDETDLLESVMDLLAAKLPTTRVTAAYQAES